MHRLRARLYGAALIIAVSVATVARERASPRRLVRAGARFDQGMILERDQHDVEDVA